METRFVVEIVLILFVAWFLGDVFRRLSLPRLLGELLAGLILGPSLLGWVQPEQGFSVLSDLGLFFLMFYAGLEMDPRELLEHFWLSLFISLGGFIVPLAAGFGVALLFGATVFQAVFIGLGLSVTGLAVGARILRDMEIHKSKVGHLIIGAAIPDDIYALVVFSVAAGIARTGRVEVVQVVLLVLKVAAFFAGTIALGQWVLPPLMRRVKDEEAKGFTFALLVALVLGALAELVGLHIIIGAFLAGQFVRREVVSTRLYEKLDDRFFNIIYGFLGPIFFASLSFHLNLRLSLHEVLFMVVLIAVALLGKFVGCGGPALLGGRGWRESVVVGLGMNARGAVELVIAKAVIVLSGGLLEAGIISRPLLTSSQFTVLILMAFLTTLIAPLSLRATVPSICSRSDRDFCTLWRESSGRSPK
jgi:Kef-type K+ transport system membrane component KefB